MESTRLPVLLPGTPYPLKATSNEEIGVAELTAIVEKFPSIAARLISLDNSTWSSPFVTVASLEMARQARAGKEAQEPPVPVNEALERHCGIGFCEAGACLAETWKFPGLLVDTLRHQQQPDYHGRNWETANLINIAGELIYMPGKSDREMLSNGDTERLGIMQALQEQVLQHIDSRKQETLELAEVLFAA